MRIVSTKEMKLINKKTQEEFFLDKKLIIENTGRHAARTLVDIFENQAKHDEIIFLIGKGSNGADGVAMARHLINFGYRCRAFVLFGEDECKEEVEGQLKIASAYGLPINHLDSAAGLSGYLEQANDRIIVVDALFGTGIQLPLSNFMYDIIEIINNNAGFIVSLDVPSGVDGDSGFVQGNAILADVTFAISFPKTGHYLAEGAKHSGEIYVLDVGVPLEEKNRGDKFLLGPEKMFAMTRQRDQFADKKVYGHALVLGGSHGLTGAPALASKSSLKVGAGLVTAATWEPQYHEMLMRLIPEVMTGYIPLDINKWDRLILDLNKYSSIILGPGLAKSTRARRLVLEVLNNFDGPVIVDADAINVLQLDEDAKVFAMRNAPTILTPHFGEFAKFTGVEQSELAKEPLKYLKSLIEKINCTVVLKGPCTYLGFSDGTVYFNHFPNDGMATGGVGDVLAGILGGLLCQETGVRGSDSLESRYKAVNQTVGIGVYLHSLAGRIAAKNFGVRPMSANSLIESLPEAFRELEKRIESI